MVEVDSKIPREGPSSELAADEPTTAVATTTNCSLSASCLPQCYRPTSLPPQGTLASQSWLHLTNFSPRPSS